MTYLVACLAVVGAVQTVLLWRTTRRLRLVEHLHDRVGRCTRGLGLLVETTEAGFTVLGAELAKTALRAARRPSSASATRRVARAAGAGKRVPEIAAEERMSEGEVRLRLSMTSTGTPGMPAHDEGTHRGPVCA
ncbi:MAG: hypothetical protein AB1806_01615 [Acidobacteriota bacterium]